MKYLHCIPVFFVFLFTIPLGLEAQPGKPFYQDIQRFKKQDSLNPPPLHAILFAGSSSFTKWTDVQAYFPGYTIINRGFGGSSLPDLIRYAGDIIFPYQPKQVVIYCGDNDFVTEAGVTAEMVIQRVKDLFVLIRRHLPAVNIAYVSIKPSPSRVGLMEPQAIANSAIARFLATQQNAEFIDVYHLMLAGNGRPKPAIFLSDSLHMNEKGYAIWKKAIEPVLLK